MTAAHEPRRSKEPPVVLKPFATPTSRLQRRIEAAALLPLGFFCVVFGFFYALTTPYLITLFIAPLAVMALLAVWALPDLKQAPTRTMGRLFFAFFICLFTWPIYLAIALPGLPWITLLRLTGIPMALLLMVSVSTSPPFRRDLAAVLNTAPPVWKMLAGFVAIQFLTIALSSNPPDSVQKFIVAQTNWTAVFLVACYVFMRPGRIERYIYVLWGMAMFICALGLWEASIQRVIWAGHVPDFLKIADAENLLQGDIRTASGKYRVKTIFTTSLGMAEFLALTTPFLLHLMATERKMIVRVAAGLSLPIVFNAISSTDSRLGMVGMLVAVVLYVLFWGVSLWRRRDAGLLGPAVVFAYPVFFTAFVGATFFVRRLEIMVWGGQATQGSNDARTRQIEMGIPKILQNPIGYGAGQGGETLGFHVGSFLTIDNYYLMIILEYGVIGFILYFGLILYMVWLAVRTVIFEKKITDREGEYIIPLAISLMVYFVVKSVFSQQDNHPLIYIMMGMMMAILYRANIKSKTPSSSAP